MSQATGNVAKGLRFDSTFRLIHAYWHITWDRGYNFLKNGFFGVIHSSTCPPGLQLHVGMLIIEIYSELRKSKRLEVLTKLS